MSLRAEVIESPGRLEELRGSWDELSVAAAQPFAAPGWLLPWWREAAPAGGRLFSLAAFDEDRLVGLAPLFLDGETLFPLGTGATTRVEPLAVRGREAEVALVLAPALGEAGASLLRLRGIPEASPWPELLAEAWRAWLHEDERMAAPVVQLHGLTLDEWLKGKSSNFRNQLRRYRRRLEERGGRIELVADSEALPAALEAFVRLHHARWESRGGSGVLDAAVEAALRRSSEELPPDRLRVFVIAAEEGIVAANVLVAAGGEVSSWLNGHDDAWGDLNPQIQLGIAAIEHALAAGDRRLDLGAGTMQHKERLANGVETLRWVTLVPRGRGHLMTRARLLPGQARLALSQHLSDVQKRRVKRMLRRGS
jgi:CelD/BcsL family acetyltransferase involved in cellulose biosynthesis